MLKKFSGDNATFAAYRVFETLKYIIKQPASVEEIRTHLESLDDTGLKNYSKAVVYKYLTTLKFAGIEFRRYKCKYEVMHLPFKIDFDKDEIIALAVLNKVLEITPENNLSQAIKDFFYQLSLRFSLKNEICNAEKEIPEKVCEKKPTAKQKNEIKNFEKIIFDNSKLNLTYLDINNTETTVLCEPIEIKFYRGNIYYSFYSIKPTEFIEINSEQIIKLEQLPTKSTNKYFPTTTIFKLKSKLANRYTLRNEECILGNSTSDEITISNKMEPKEVLMRRLLRYGELCEVISPKCDRELMKEIVNRTLKQYKGT